MSYRLKLNIILGLFMTFIFAFSADAQRRRTTRTSPDRNELKAEEQGSWLGVSIGNLGFNRGFVASGKVSYGYDINKIVGVGINAKFFFDNFNQIGPDINLFSYGGAAFTRLSITKEFFLQGEYGRTNFEVNENLRETHTYPSAGAGYKSGFGNWTYGLHVLFPLKERPRDILNIEYWIDFNYKF
jgi:hypothetical protein